MQRLSYELPLVRTKLFIPPSQRLLVPRQRLLHLLEQSAHQLTVIIAGAGWGKSTLLGQWAERQTQPVGWISLDANDNEPIRFLSYLLAAFQMIDPDIGSAVMSNVQSPQPAAPEVILTRLLNELTRWHEEHPHTSISLILDDFNVIESPEVLELVSLFVDRLPTAIRLIIASRTEPQLPLGRWRVYGQLQEIRTAELRFSLQEIQQFFRSTVPLELPPQALEILDQRTEGWIAGLHLAGLAAQNQADISTFIASFAGSHRYILEYLVGDVVAHQPVHIQAFLYATAILERMCAPLADALLHDTSTPPAVQILAYLQRQQLFLVPLDNEGRWYRYHHLFADLLRYHLQQHSPERIPQLHRRASRWYAAQELLEDAIFHSLASNDLNSITSLITEHARTLLMRGAATTVQTWLQRLPRPHILAHPHLAVIQAWVDLVLVRPTEIEFFLQAAERHLTHVATEQQTRIKDEMTAIRAILPRFTDAISVSIERSEAALASIDPQDVTLHGIVAGNLTVVNTLLGNLSAASAAAALAIQANQASGNTFAAMLAICDQGILQSLAGHLYAAAETFQQGLRLAEQQGWLLDPAYGSLHIGLAHVLYEWNHLEQALELVEKGIKIAHKAGYLDIAGDGLLVQVKIMVAQGHLEAATALLETALKTAERNQVERFIYRVKAYQAKLAIQQHKLNKARQLLPHIPTTNAVLDLEYTAEYLVQLAVAVFQADWDSAEQQAAQLTKILGERTGAQIELLILQALMAWGQEHRSEALDYLQTAVDAAQPGGYIRIFLDIGPALIPLLQALHSTTTKHEYLHRLLSFMHIPADPAMAYEQLSVREKEVLHWVEAGYTNQEIADQLFLSVGTVKRHLSNIYGKLEVGNRTEALARARELGIFP